MIQHALILARRAFIVAALAPIAVRIAGAYRRAS